RGGCETAASKTGICIISKLPQARERRSSASKRYAPETTITRSRRFEMARFPFGLPNSWYLVAFSDELEEGALRPLPYLGRNLIAIRDAGGRVSVLDGYC